MNSIYRYFISLLVTVGTFSFMYGQEIETEKKDSLAHIQLHGFRVDVDVSPIVTSFMNGSDVLNYEAAVQLDINHKYYPVFEMGYASADKLTTSAINYQGNALFYRIGLDFNLIKQKKETKVNLNNIFLVGGRLGFTQFDYNLSNIQLRNDYWGNTEIKDLEQISVSKLWYEIVVGVRVEILKNIFIGWSVRSKNLLTKDKAGNFKPWHVPGFGINSDSSVWGLNYMLGYKF